MPIIYERDNGGIHRSEESAGSSWNRAIGPFYSPKGVARRLNIDGEILSRMLTDGKILAVRTSDRQIVYPIRQFIDDENGTVSINPAVAPALQFFMIHEEEFTDVRGITDEKGIPLINEWTIAAALLQPNEKGEVLLDSLHQNLNNPDDESWQRLLTLNGMVSGLRKVLSESDSDE